MNEQESILANNIVIYSNILSSWEFEKWTLKSSGGIRNNE